MYSSDIVAPPGYIGFYYRHENRRSFTLHNKVISGCCEPLEYRLFDKETGKELKNFGPCVWYSGDDLYNFVLYFTDTTYNKLTLHFIDAGKQMHVRIPKGCFRGISLANKPELYFDEGKIEKGVFTISYSYQPYGQSEWKKGLVRVVLTSSKQ